MIEREHFNGPIIFRCDGCPETAETHCEFFNGAQAKIKSRGWTTYKDVEEGLHLCPECSR